MLQFQEFSCLSSENLYDVQLWPRQKDTYNGKIWNLLEILNLVHLSRKLKLIWWISLSLNFRRNWWKNIFSGQFHILQCKVSFCLGHWTSYKFSEIKHENSWNGRKHKIFFDISLIFLCIFGYISNSRWQTHWNVEN